MKRKHSKYRKFTLDSIILNIQKYIKEFGQKASYSILLLFFAFKRKDTPHWAKNIIIGAIAYFLSPIDSIPDLTPFLGLTDDMGVLSFGLVMIACYINDDVRSQAKEKMINIFGEVDEEVILEVNQTL